MHNIYKEYEKRVAIYDTRVRKEILHEIREDERALMEEVREIEKRIKANSFKRETKKFVNEETDKEFARRDKVTHLLTHSLTHSLTHTLTHPLTHSLRIPRD